MTHTHRFLGIGDDGSGTSHALCDCGAERWRTGEFETVREAHDMPLSSYEEHRLLVRLTVVERHVTEMTELFAELYNRFRQECPHLNLPDRHPVQQRH